MNKELESKVTRAIATVFVAAGFAFAIVQEQIIVAIAVLAAGFAILQVLKARYKSVISSDERTKRINEKAAMNTLTLFMVSGAVLIITQLALDFAKIDLPQLKAFTEPLSYLIIVFMAVYSILAMYHSRKM